MIRLSDSEWERIRRHFPEENISEGRPVISLADKHKLPAVYEKCAFPEAGGLMSYGISFAEAFRHVGVYTGQILNGTKPFDLPVQQSTKRELVINLKAAAKLGLEVPQSLIARADKVIESSQKGPRSRVVRTIGRRSAGRDERLVCHPARWFRCHPILRLG
jgi:ABC transporter substrate binding protein